MEPVYATLARRLRGEITSGTYEPGTFLPSEAALAGAQNVSRSTVRRALDELVAQGLVIAHNGRGHQVRRVARLVWRACEPEIGDGDGPAPSDSWSRSVRAQGFEPSETITAEIGYADEPIARWLDLPIGEAVAIRRRLRFVDGAPSSIADSYYPRTIVKGTEIEEPADVQPGVYAVFAKLGREWVRTRDRWTARPPTREETAVLAIPRGVAVAEIARRSFDREGVPVRLSLFVLPGDRHEVEYDHWEVIA